MSELVSEGGGVPVGEASGSVPAQTSQEDFERVREQVDYLASAQQLQQQQFEEQAWQEQELERQAELAALLEDDPEAGVEQLLDQVRGEYAGQLEQLQGELSGLVAQRNSEQGLSLVVGELEQLNVPEPEMDSVRVAAERQFAETVRQVAAQHGASEADVYALSRTNPQVAVALAQTARDALAVTAGRHEEARMARTLGPGEQGQQRAAYLRRAAGRPGESLAAIHFSAGRRR